MWSTGHAEEALDLAGVQIHREHAVDARGLEHVGHQARGDRLARRRLLVLARVREPRHDGGDALGRGQARRVDHDQELDQVVVARARAGLDQEDVGAAHRLVEAHVRLGVRERLERRRRRSATPSSSAMRSARSMLERPAKSIMRRNEVPSRELLRGSSRRRCPRRAAGRNSLAPNRGRASLLARPSGAPSTRAAYPGLVVWRGRAIASAPASTSSVITLPAAT